MQAVCLEDNIRQTSLTEVCMTIIFNEIWRMFKLQKLPGRNHLEKMNQQVRIHEFTMNRWLCNVLINKFGWCHHTRTVCYFHDFVSCWTNIRFKEVESFKAFEHKHSKILRITFNLNLKSSTVNSKCPITIKSDSTMLTNWHKYTDGVIKDPSQLPESVSFYQLQ